MDNKKLAKEYFATHPTVEEFHFTADGQAFINKTDAEAHARSLADKGIECVKRGADATEGESESGETKPPQKPAAAKKAK